jgi:GNAT superfamily N-acetyltransferase
MSENVIIRPWTMGDESAIHALLLELQKHEETLTPVRRPWVLNDAHDYWESLKPRLQVQEGVCLLAEVDGKVVGFSIGWIEHDVYEKKVHPHEARYAFLSEGYVYPEHRRGKVFSQLVKAMEQYFYGIGIRRIRRGSFANNSNLLAAANAQGYQLYEFTLEKVL